MAGRNMDLAVMVRLRDQLSGPLRGLQNNLRKLTGFARSIGVIGTAVAGISFMGPIQEAAAFEQKLLDIAGTAELSGRAAFSFVDEAGRRYEDLALQIGQHSDTIAQGVGQMIAAGVDQNLIDRSIGAIGRAATAANAEFADMASIAQASIINLKAAPEDIEDMLGALVIAGKQGSFELKDMARHFAQLTPQVAKFGITGREAVNFLGSGLQIAMKGASDPAQAANNFRNFLSKALSPDTMKRFAEQGVNLQAVMLDATAKGINPLEAMLQKVVKLTGVGEDQIAKYMATAKAQGLEGADALGFVREQLEAIGAAGEVSKLFGDQQVLDFIIPFLANVDEYKRIKAEVAAATGAAIDADFETQMEGLNRQMIRFREIGTQATRIVGFAFGKWMPTINGHLETALRWVRELDKSSGGMVSTIITMGGGVLIAVAALGALGLVLPIVGAGLGALGALAALVLSPIGLVIGALALGALHIGRNWDRYGPRLRQIWQRARDGFMGFARDGIAYGRRLIASGRELATRYGPVVAAALSRAWQAVNGWIDQYGPQLRAGVEQVWRDAVALGDRYGPMLENGFQKAFEGAKSAGGEFVSGFATHNDEIGNELDRLVKNAGSIGGTLKGIFTDLWTIMGNTEAGGVEADWAGFGDVIGREVKNAITDFNSLAEGIGSVLEAIREITKAVATGEPIPWKNIMPEGVVAAYEKVVGAINKVKQALAEFKAWLAGFSLPQINLSPLAGGTAAQPGQMLPNGTPAGDPAKGGAGMGEDRERALDDFLSPPPRPDRRSDAGGLRRLASAEPRQPVRLDGNVGITIKVDGPGKVTSANSDNPQVKAGGAGRTIGRV